MSDILTHMDTAEGTVPDFINKIHNDNAEEGKRDNKEDFTNSTEKHARTDSLTFPSDKGDSPDKGLLTIEMGNGDDVTATFDPQKRADRMSYFRRDSLTDMTLTEQGFEGREDGLKRQKTSRTNNKFEVVREYDSEKRTDGLISESINYKTGITTRNYDPAKNPDRMTQEKISGTANCTKTERTFDNTGVKTAEIVLQYGSGKEQIIKQFRDGSQLDTTIEIDGTANSIITDAQGRTKVSTDNRGAWEKKSNNDRENEAAIENKGEATDAKKDAGKDSSDGKDGEDAKKRREEELKKYRDKLEEENKLPPIERGKGPYDSIRRAIEQGKLPPMSHKETLKMARDIRDRDQRNGKKAYREGERVEIESKDKIDQKVEQERKRLEERDRKQIDWRGKQGDDKHQGGNQRQQEQGSDAGKGFNQRQQEQGSDASGQKQDRNRGQQEQGSDGSGKQDGSDTGKERQSDGMDRQNEPVNEDPKITESRKRLEETAERTIKDPKQLEEFKANMRKFQERARVEGLSVNEVARTFDNIDKLMGAPKGFIEADRREILAKQAMWHLADPTNIDQGGFNTCNVTTMQEKLFTTHPSKVTDMITTAALTGKLTTPNGVEIRLDRGSMTPLPGSADARLRDGERSYLTQVCNHIMVNEISQQRMPPEVYKQLHVGEDGKPLKHGDNGERLYGPFGIPKLEDNSDPLNGPEVEVTEMAESLRRYTGETEILWLEGGFSARAEKGLLKRFSSPEELAEALTKAQQSKKVPIILYVDGRDKVYTDRERKPGEQHGAHVITIRGYDPETGLVTISNQWGKGSDRKVPIEELYRTTKPPVMIDGKKNIIPSPTH